MGRMSEFSAYQLHEKAVRETQRVFDVLQAKARQVPLRPTQSRTDQVAHANYLQRSFGTKFAAKFLRSRGWSFENAMSVLSIKG